MKLKKAIGVIVLAALLIALLSFLYSDQLRSRTTSDFTARVNASSLYLKSGPGEQFERLGLYPHWSSVSLIGKAPGERWYFVKTSDGKTGWMAAEFLTLPGNVDQLPEKAIQDATVISGSVVTSDGKPGDEVRLSISPKDNPSASSIVYTASSGEFVAYLPPDASGEWVMAIGGIGCKSHLMDPDCQMSQYFAHAPQQEFSLPAPAPIQFVYEKATAWIKGVVYDANGSALAEALVIARSSEGSLSGRRAQKDGTFTLPLAAGEWQIHCQVEGNPGEMRPVSIQEGQTITGFNLNGP